jgi:hypothetical protein
MKAVFASALGARISSPVKISPPETAPSDLSSLIALCTFRPGWLQLSLVTFRPIEKKRLTNKSDRFGAISLFFQCETNGR